MLLKNPTGLRNTGKPCIEYGEMKDSLVLVKPRNTALPVSRQLPLGERRREKRDLHCHQKRQGNELSTLAEIDKIYRSLQARSAGKKKIHSMDWKQSVARIDDRVGQSSERRCRVDRVAQEGLSKLFRMLD